jgi:predicted permease
MGAILDDIRHSVKTLGRAPGFTIVVVTVLALGIGATSAIFSVLSAMLLRPVPFPEPDRVLNLAWNYGDYISPDLTSAKFSYWQEHSRTFAGVASWQPFYGREGEVGEISGVRGLKVTRGFFDVLGLTPAVGREFTEEEHRTGGPRVALVTRAFWRERFGERVDLSRNAVVILEEEPHVVVGLLPDEFAFPYEADAVEMIVPTAISVDPDDESANWPALVRLGDGFTVADARAEVSALNGGFRNAYPQQVSEHDIGMTLGTFAQLYVGETAKAVWILMAAVGAVLLIACANVGNLFLARALRRRGETAVRAALGATAARIMRLVLIEALLVGFAAVGAGMLLAQWSATVLVSLAPVRLPFAGPVGIDWRVAAFTVTVALAASVVVSGVAAWPGVRGGVWQALGRSSRGTTARGWLQQGLLSGQTALSMLLLVAAGLLIATWSNLRQVNPGFDPDALVAVRLPIRPPSYDTSLRLWEFERRVIEEMTASGSVVALAGATSLPFERGLNFPMSIGGRDEFGGSIELRAVTPGYFETLGIDLISGRPFRDTDAAGAMNVAIGVTCAEQNKFLLDSLCSHIN